MARRRNRERKPLRQQIRERKGAALVYFILRLLVIFVMVRCIFDRDYESLFLCILTLILFTVPTMLERRMRIDIPDALEIIILLFIYAAQILGEIRSFYIYFPNWDTVLHTLNGFLAAAIGFALVDILNEEESVSMRLSPVTMAIVAFCFSMTIGVVWEFFEFAMDYFFGLDMQKDTILHAINSVKLSPGVTTIPTGIRNITDVIVVTADGSQHPLGLGGYLDIGLHDTMMDLLVNFIGAFVFSTLGYFYVRARGAGRFKRLKSLLPTKVRQTLNLDDDDGEDTNHA
jgi:hypothetical protein